MKHNWPVTLTLLGLFLAAQILGLFVVRHYIEKPNLPFDVERPEFEEKTSFIPLFIIIIIATCFAFLLAKLNAVWAWKLWFFLSIAFTVTVSLSIFVRQLIALLLASVLAYFKTFRDNVIIHNLGELLIYGGLAAIFVDILNIFSISILLILISVYDYIAVRRTKHMVTLAKFQSKIRIFAGLLIPSKKGAAILGGGDIGFTLLFAGVVMKSHGFKAFIIPLFATLALFYLFVKSEKKKFYPAMPFLTVGCFLGYLVVLLV